MTLLFVFLFVAGLWLFTIGYHNIKDGKKPIAGNIVMFILGTFSVAIFSILAGVFAEREDPKPLHTTKYNVTTEIVQEYTNGVETKVDTIYTFTLKK